MHQRIAHVALVVKDYDEAIDFYVNKLEFQLLTDTKLSEEKRWVIIAPPGAKECCLLLSKAENEEEAKSIGYQTGGKVSFYLFTDDFERDYQKYKEKDISFVSSPQSLDFGKVVIFKDLYGNRWDLIQPNENNKGFIMS